MLKNSRCRSAISLAALILALMIVFILPALAEGVQSDGSESGASLSDNTPPENSQPEAHTHEWSNTEYIVSEDGTTVSAHTSCEICKASQDASATLQVTDVSPTCSAPGYIIKQASFNPPLQSYYNMSESGEPPFGHNFGSPTYSMSSDCASMTASRSCQRVGCNAVEEETASAASQTISEPSCVDPGETQYTTTFQSSIFGTHTISVITPAKGHSMTKTEAHAATCEAPGNSEYYTCSVCGKFFSDEAGTNEISKDSWVLPAAGHTPVKTAAADPTCEAPGNTEYYTCSACGKFFSDEAGTAEIAENSWVIPAIGHTSVKTAAADPTCEAPGNTEYYTCSVCNKYFSDEACTTAIEQDSWVLPAAGHTPVKTAAADPTCEAPGNTEYYTCSACGKFFSDEACTTAIEQDSWILPATGHTPVKTAAADPTCELPGNKEYYTCSACGRFFSDEACTAEIEQDSWVIPALGHTPVKTAAVEPTCEAPGNTEYYTCSVCGKFFSDEACTTEIEKDSWILPAVRHTVVKVEAVPAACVTPGNSEYYVCTACGRFFSDEAATDEQEIEENSWVIEPLGHTMEGHGAVAPTCTRTGHAAFWVCTRCQEVFADADGQTPTTVENQSIRARGHKVEHVGRKESTCTEQGYAEHYICKDCGSIFMDEAAKTPLTQEQILLPLASHTGGTAICGQQAVCEVCGQKYGPVGDHPSVIDHVYSYKKESGNSKAYLMKYCSACGTVISVDADPDTSYLAELMQNPGNITEIDLPDNAEFPDPESLMSAIPSVCNEEIPESVQPMTSAEAVKYTLLLKADEASTFLEKTDLRPNP